MALWLMQPVYMHVGIYLVNGLVLIRCESVGQIKSQQLLQLLLNPAKEFSEI